MHCSRDTTINFFKGIQWQNEEYAIVYLRLSVTLVANDCNRHSRRIRLFSFFLFHTHRRYYTDLTSIFLWKNWIPFWTRLLALTIQFLVYEELFLLHRVINVLLYRNCSMRVIRNLMNRYVCVSMCTYLNRVRTEYNVTYTCKHITLTYVVIIIIIIIM